MIYPNIIFAISLTQKLFSYIQHLGVFGPFLLGVFDAIFFLPFSLDFLIIAKVSSSQSKWMWMLYVIMASLGSLAGTFMVDLVMRKIGEKGLEIFIKPKKIEKIKRKVKDKIGLTIFIAALLPPPFPFTAVIWTASALKSPRKSMFTALFFGRIVRFTVEALLSLYFGKRLLEYADSKVLTYFIYALVAISLLGSIYYVYKWTTGWRGMQSPNPQSAS